jgi:hypothetical protein
MDKPNRAERRKNRFGGGRATEHGGWPTHQPNPVFTGDTPAAEAPLEKPAKVDDAAVDADPEKGETTTA